MLGLITILFVVFSAWGGIKIAEAWTEQNNHKKAIVLALFWVAAYVPYVLFVLEVTE